MHIGIVGGIDRNESEFRDTAERLGCAIRFHCGDVRGRGSDSLFDLIAAVDLVIVVTDVNSHGGVILARRLARRFGKRVVLHRRFRPARLAEVLSAA